MSAKKLKGDVAEQVVVLEGLRRGWSVLKPFGDRLPYDIVFEHGGAFARIQVRATWLDRGQPVADFRKGDKSKALPSADCVDFGVAVALDGTCYVVPVVALAPGKRTLWTYHDYREGWEAIFG